MPANPQDSYAPLVFDLVFITEDGVAYPLPSHEFLQSFTMQLFSDRAWQASLRLFDRSGGQLTRFIGLLGNRDSARFNIRWGWDSLQGKNDYEWIVGQVLGYSVSVMPRVGTTIDITLAPDGVPDALVKRRDPPWAFPEGTTIKDIVQKVVEAHKWEFAIGADGKSSLQDTTTTLPSEVSQVGESDMAFLNGQVAYLAEDSDGSGGFRFFIDKDGKAHFHNQFHTAAQASYVYKAGDDINGEVISFSMTDNTAFSAVMGGGNAEYRSADSDDGTANETTATQEGGLEGKKHVALKDATYNDNLGPGATCWINLFEREPEAAVAKASQQYLMMSSQQYVGALCVRGTHRVEPMDYIEVEFLNSDGTRNFLSGTMQVLNMTHSVSLQGWTTDMTVCKGGTSWTPDGIRKVADKQLDPAIGNGTSSASDQPGAANTTQSQKTVKSGGDDSRRPAQPSDFNTQHIPIQFINEPIVSFE